MNNRKRMIFCIALILMIISVLTLAGCGGSESRDYGGGDVGTAESAVEDAKSANGFSTSDEEFIPYEPSEADASYGTIQPGLPPTVDPTRVKLIYTADIWVETMDFDQTMKDLNAMVESVGGYFESSNTENGSYWAKEGYKYGNFTVRVPSDKYQEFVSSVSDGMHVTQLSQNTQDIGQAYYEAESHLETLRNKHARLEELLQKAGSLSDIIELENALSQTEYELEQYSNELERYDSLIDYSTVTVNVETASQYSPGVGEDRGFFRRVWDSIKDGLAGFGEGFTDLCEWFGYHLIQIIIVIVIVALFVKFGPHAKGRLKIGKGAKNNKAKADEQIEVIRTDQEGPKEE
ncbi:MAG: DUF4349 domain-containing protein [Firmicutes bacterium]|nr:DUF4349 domain-containing protein [Bacillota bacterium]